MSCEFIDQKPMDSTWNVAPENELSVKKQAYAVLRDDILFFHHHQQESWDLCSLRLRPLVIGVECTWGNSDPPWCARMT